jgi:hypothetical protein
MGSMAWVGYVIAKNDCDFEKYEKIYKEWSK